MSRASLPYIVRRAALAGLAIGALVAGLAATSAAITGYAQAGVFSELPGGVVLSVSPTGHAWRAGIRAGQVVDALDSEDAPTGWRIETHDPRGRYTATGVGANETLRLSLPLALTGLGAACLAVLFLRTRRRWVMPAAAVGLLAASVPLLYEGGADMSTVVLAGAATVPGVALSVHLSGGWQLRVPVIAAIVGGAIAWAVARLGGWDAFPGFEDARGNLALWGTLLLVLDRTLVPAFAGERLHVTRPRLADVAMITGLAVVALTLMLVKALGEGASHSTRV